MAQARFANRNLRAKWFLSIVVAGIALAGRATGADETPSDFNQSVAPIFKTYCVACHNGEDKEGGLVLESFETLGKGGEDGPVVVPGKPDESLIVQVLRGKAEPAMPPEGNERPSEAEIARLAAWIAGGAKPPAAPVPDPAVLSVPQIPLQVPARATIHAAAWSADGKSIALAGYRRVWLVSPESRGLVRELAAPTGAVTDLVFSADGKQLFAAGGEPGLYGEIAVIDVAAGKMVRTLKGHKDSLYAVALSPDGKLLASGSYDQQIHLWNPTSGEAVGILEGHSGAVFDLAFHKNGQWLASASADRTAKLWDVAARKRLDTFAQPLGEQYSVAFSPDGQRVVAGGVDNRIRLWHVSSTAQEGSNPIVYSKFAHQAPIIKLAYAPNGKLLASAAEDRTVRLFAGDTLNELKSLEIQPDGAPALAFSPDSKRLFVGRLDGSFAIYDADSGELAPPARPELASLPIKAIQRGRASKISVAGKNLLGASRVEFNHEKLSGMVLPESVAPTADRAVVEVTADAIVPRGIYEMSIVTAGGKSAGAKLYVDDLAQSEEREPNNSPGEAGAVALPGGFWGTVAVPGDDDYYRFEAAAGQTIVFELAAKSLGSKLNGVLTLFDAKGAVIASNNDFDAAEDPLLAHTFAGAGSYLIRVSDLTQSGSTEHFYRLSAGAFPYVTACFPLSVPAGKASEVELVGYNLGSDAKVALPAADAGEIVVSVDAERYRSRKDLKVAVGNLPEVLEHEPNDTVENATAVSTPVTVGGRIWSVAQNARLADIDLFRFDSKAGQQWIIETDAARRDSPVDTKIDVLDAKGQPITRIVLEAVRDSAINFRGITSAGADVRVDNWEEMELNEFMYLGGEVCKIFRLPQGPDSGFLFYNFAGSRLCYFDTSATSHAVGDACYIVEPHPPGTPLVPNGLPVFPLYYSNDDDGMRKLGRDSRLTFAAPADGTYLVRVRDVRSSGGDRFAYRLTIRPPKPDFHISVGGANPAVKAGSGRSISFTADRIDGFDGDIVLEVTGLPPGFSVSSPVVIAAGQNSANAVVYAAADAPKPTEQNNHASRVTATAVINGSPLSKEVSNLGTIKLAPRGPVRVRIEPAELTIAPGSSVTARLKVERNGFDGRIRFDVENLPHGVIVDNIGLNGVLIPEGQNERDIFLTARNWLPETNRTFFAVTQEPPGEASSPAVLHVRRPAAVAQASATSAPPAVQSAEK